MYDSKIKASTLINELKNSLDVAEDISSMMYASWINEVEQFLYTEIIKEQREYKVSGYYKPLGINLSAIDVADTEDDVRFDDVVAVYYSDTSTPQIKEVQLTKTTLADFKTFTNTYCKKSKGVSVTGDTVYGELIDINTHRENEPVRVVYIVRPKLKTEDNVSNLSLNVPPEFVSLIRAKLCGEAYKYVNEDSIAAKWLNDYNILLETFKKWVAEKNPAFGWRV